MPKDGDFSSGQEIGKANKRRYIYTTCSDCGEGRWVIYTTPYIVRKCTSCCQKKSYPYKGTITNPALGDIRMGWEIGKQPKHSYIYHACETCGKPSWVEKRKGQVASNICMACHLDKRGSQANKWRGGKGKTMNGYVTAWVDPDDFFYPMANCNGRILEHRLVMARHIGRCLQDWEVVHHKNGNRTDNRIENLELSSSGNHIIAHSKGYRDGYAKGLIDGRTKQIEELKEQNETLIREIRFLQLQVKGDLV